MATRIYIADIAPLKEEAVFAEYYGTVSKQRKEKIDRMRSRKDKCLSLGAEILLQQACRDFGVSYRDETVAEGEYEKPFFSSGRISFNLSHSGERVMCIMSDREAGCDVQQIGTPRLRVARRFFSASESALITSLTDPEEQADLFYRVWTLKESFIKCVGRGLSLPLSEFTMLLDREPAGISQSIDDCEYTFGEYDPGDGYRYAWCVKETGDGSQETGDGSLSPYSENSENFGNCQN